MAALQTVTVAVLLSLIFRTDALYQLESNPNLKSQNYPSEKTYYDFILGRAKKAFPGRYFDNLAAGSRSSPSRMDYWDFVMGHANNKKSHPTLSYIDFVLGPSNRRFRRSAADSQGGEFNDAVHPDYQTFLLGRKEQREDPEFYTPTVGYNQQYAKVLQAINKHARNGMSSNSKNPNFADLMLKKKWKPSYEDFFLGKKSRAVSLQDHGLPMFDAFVSDKKWGASGGEVSGGFPRDRSDMPDYRDFVLGKKSNPEQLVVDEKTIWQSDENEDGPTNEKPDEKA